MKRTEFYCDTCKEPVSEREAREHRTIRNGRFEVHHADCCPWCNNDD